MLPMAALALRAAPALVRSERLATVLASVSPAVVEGIQALVGLVGPRLIPVTGEIDDELIAALEQLPASARARFGSGLERLLWGDTDAEEGNLSDPLPAVSKTASKTPGPLKDLASYYARSQGIDPLFVHQVIQIESRWNPDAGSPTGAKGLMQLTSIAVREVAQKDSVGRPSNIWKPETNLDFGTRLLRIIGRSYLKLPAAALANPTIDQRVDMYGAYNLGIGAYRKLLAGDFASPLLVETWSKQAPSLKRGGIAEYRNNVRRYMEV